MQLSTTTNASNLLPPDNTLFIEQEFQEYFKVVLHKQDVDCYFVPEWETHFDWGKRQYTLRQLQVLLRGHRQLAAIAPEIQSFSWLSRSERHLGH